MRVSLVPVRSTALACALLPAALFARPRRSEAQEWPPRITVRVQQVAGTSVYVEVGTRNGLAQGDTLDVFRDSTDTSEKRLVVVASSEHRSVLTFAGTPFPLTRGASLILQLLRKPAETPPEPTVATSAAADRPVPEPTAVAPRSIPRPAEEPRVDHPSAPALPAHGRVSLGFSGVRSSTQIGGTDPTSVDRMFATPAMGLVLTVPDAVGHMQLRTNMRLAYRYSDQDIIQPALSARVYDASLDGRFDGYRVMVGRFHSPVEPYSGFWDGALLRVGGTGLGIGAIAGFEPDRWNESPSTSAPKATIFVDGRGRGDGWRWSGNLSAHEVRPRNGEAQHRFFGASQRLSAGPLGLSHDVEVDRDPGSGRWKVSRLLVRGSVELPSGWELRGGVAREEPWIPELLGSPFGYRRDRANAGLAYHGPVGFASLDASMGKDAAGSRTWGGTGVFSLNRLPGLAGVGLLASVSRWSGGYGTSESASPMLSFDLPSVRLRAGYRISRNDYLGDPIVTHSVEGALDLPFGAGFRLTSRARVQFGGYLSSQSFDLGLYRVF